MPPLFFNTNTNALIAKSIGNNQLVLTECCCPTVVGCVDCNFDTLAVTFSGFSHSSENFNWANGLNNKTFYLSRGGQSSVNQDLGFTTCIWQYTIPCGGPLLLLTITGNTTIAFTIGGTILSITKKLKDAKITPSVSTCAYSLPKPGLPAATTPPYEDFTREGDFYNNGTITIGSANNNSINPETRCSAGILTTTVTGTHTYSVQTNSPDDPADFPPLEGPVFYKFQYNIGGIYDQATYYSFDGSFACTLTTGGVPGLIGEVVGAPPTILSLVKTDDQNSTANILEKVNHAPTNILLQTASYAENIAGQVVGTFTTIDGGIYDIQYRGEYNNNTTYTDGDVVYTYINSEIRYRYIDPINNSVGNSPPSNKWVVVPTINTSACTYTLVAGSGDDDNSSFTISTNQLIASIPFNYEAKNSYKIRIRSTDNGFYESGIDRLYLEKTFTIPVYNTNEAPTEIFLSGNLNVLENIPAGFLIGTFSMSDPDSPPNLPALPIQSRIQYLGVDYAQTGGSGSDASSFSYSSRDSQDRLELRTNAIFNREAKSSYTLALRAYDAGSLSSPVKIFTINILDNNEAPINITLNHDYLWDPTNTRYQIAEYPNCLAQSASRIAVATISVSDPDGAWPIGNIFGDSNVVTLSNNDHFELLPDSMILYIKQGVNLSYNSWPPYGVISTEVIVTDSSIVPYNERRVTCNVYILPRPLAATRLALDIFVNTIDKDTLCPQPIGDTVPNSTPPHKRCIWLATVVSNNIRQGSNVVFTNSNDTVFELYGGKLFLKAIVVNGVSPTSPNLAPGDYTTTITRYDPDAICSPGRPNVTLSVTYTLHVLSDNHICCSNVIYGYSSPANQTISGTYASYPNPNDHSVIASGTSIGIGVGANLRCVGGCNMSVSSFGGGSGAVFDTIVSGGSVSNIHVVKHGSGYAKECHIEPIQADIITVVTNSNGTISTGTGLAVQYTFQINSVAACEDTWTVKRDNTTSGGTVTNGGTGYAQGQLIRISSTVYPTSNIPKIKILSTSQGSIDVINLIPEISAKATSGSGGIATFTPTFEGYTPQTLPNNTNVRFWKIPSLSLISSNASDFVHNAPIILTLLNGTTSFGAGFVFTGSIKIALSAPILKIRDTNGTGATFVVNGSLDSDTGYYTITSIDISSPGTGYADMDTLAAPSQLYLTFNNVEVEESGGFSNYDFVINEETGAFESLNWYGPTEIRCKGPIVNTEVTNVGAYYKPTSIVQWVNIGGGSLYSLGNSTPTTDMTATFDGNCAPCASMQPSAEAVVDLNKDSTTYGGILSVNIISGGSNVQASSGYDWIASMNLGDSPYGAYIYLVPPQYIGFGLASKGVGGARSNFPRNCPPNSWPSIPVWHIMQRVGGASSSSFDHDNAEQGLSCAPFVMMSAHDIDVMYQNHYSDLLPCNGTIPSLNLGHPSGIWYINTGITLGMSWSGS